MGVPFVAADLVDGALAEADDVEWVKADLRRWAGKKYRRLRTYNRFKRWWAGLLERDPGLFAHWRWVRAY